MHVYPLYDRILAFAEIIAQDIELSCAEAHGLSLEWINQRARSAHTLSTALENPSNNAMSFQVPTKVRTKGNERMKD